MFHGPNRGTPRIARKPLRRNRPFLKATATIVTAAFLGLTLQPLAVAAGLPDRQPRHAAATPPAPTDAERLSQTLERVERHLDKLHDKLNKRQDIAPEHKELKALRTEINLLDRQALADFDGIERHIKAKNLPPEILKRHQEAVKTYKTEMTALKTNLGEVYWAEDDAQRGPKLKKAREHLKAKQLKKPRAKLDPKKLPSRALEPNKNNKPKLKKEDFRAAGLFNTPHVKLAALGDFTFDKLPGASDPAYLAATADVVLSDAIKAQAQALNYDPVRIFQFVQNNIEWAPSWGSIQGSDLTFRSRRGNSVDSASLLIALLRASGIPSRYVHGTIEVPAARFMNWAGGFTDINSAVDFASSGGIPITVVVTGGKVSSVRLEHIWVEAAIDFYPSRGAVNKSADAWIQLDPSFKQHDITPGTDLTDAVPFSADVYLGQLRTENPVQYYQQQLQSYLDANLPDRTLGQIMGFRVIRQEVGTVLPSALPWKTVVAANRYGTLPAALRAAVQLELASSDGLSSDTAAFTTPELAGKRLTLSYAPASSADEALIAGYGGDMYAVPPYLLYLVPVLKADGQVIYTGPALAMGQEQRLRVAYQAPSVNATSMPHKLTSGGYYALGLNLQGVNESVLGNSNGRVIDTLITQTATTAPADDTLGQHLYSLAMTYFLMNDKLYRGAAKLYQVEAQRALSAGLVGISPTVSYYFGIPRSATPNRLAADIGLEAIQATSREGDATKLKSFLELRGLTGSFSESAVFEAIHGFDSVSAVKALQASAAQGVPVYKIDQTNIGQILPLLQLPAEDRQEIQDGVAVGLTALVPQRDITINDWRGTGFIIKDPQTSSGVYRISGGLSGGSTTKHADGFQIVSLFKGAFAWLWDKLDVIFRGAIKSAAELQHASGDIVADPRIAKVANDKLGEGYDDVFQCSGLVRLAYKAAGMCLDFNYDEYGKWKACWNPPSIAQQAGVNPGPDDNGVKVHYNIANALKQNNSVRKTNDPLVGDIVFFDNTTGPGQPLNHEGIVVTGPDTNGKIEFIHAGQSGVNKARMNILIPADAAGNSVIGDTKRCGAICLAGQLFAGYGTIRDPRTLKK
jgi:hypothetical protein